MNAIAPAPPARAAGRRVATPPRLRLPETIRACPFDLDGVRTDAARVHADASEETFAAFLREHAFRALDVAVRAAVDVAVVPTPRPGWTPQPRASQSRSRP